MVKHRAIPDAASRKRQGGKEPRACAGNGACGGPGGDYAADADQPGKQVADGVGIKRQGLWRPTASTSKRPPYK